MKTTDALMVVECTDYKSLGACARGTICRQSHIVHSTTRRLAELTTHIESRCRELQHRIFAIAIVTGSSMVMPGGRSNQQSVNICETFDRLGACRFGSRCRYAHVITRKNAGTAEMSIMFEHEFKRLTQLIQQLRVQVVPGTEVVIDSSVAIPQNHRSGNHNTYQSNPDDPSLPLNHPNRRRHRSRSRGRGTTGQEINTGDSRFSDNEFGI